MLAILIFVFAAMNGWAADVSLAALDLSKVRQGWDKAQANKSVTGAPLRIGGTSFAQGVGTHADSLWFIDLKKGATRFHAMVGIDDGVNGSPAACVRFVVSGGGKQLWASDLLKAGQAPVPVDLDVTGVKILVLEVKRGISGIESDHADWADATLVVTGDAPESIDGSETIYAQAARPAAPEQEAVLLTPSAPPEPRINGPKVYGVRPGSPFLYRIPCTGQRPIRFRADALPQGLVLNPATGIITGQIAESGTYNVVLFAKNDLGEVQRKFRIEAGNKLALTPPMGWNDWYIYYDRVTEATLRHAADQMIASGMADFGYQYVNCDDCWMMKPGDQNPDLGGAPRDASGRLQPNKRFPDIKGMVDYIHSKGLKAGIYTSPGPLTCGGFEGSWHHEAEDAKTFSKWGFDFLKYDWCSYGSVAGGTKLEDLKKPYQLMWDELQKQNRDIVFNLCQYGKGDVWKWGGEVGHCWRTTDDLGREKGSILPGFYRFGMSNASHWEFARPGAWNDPDYILIGWVGDALAMGMGKKTTLSPNEQYSYMSMWSLMAAPLIFSGDMTKLDPFTLNVLCNSEVIDVDQDPLGHQAKPVRQTHDEFVLVKELDDGSKAVGLFNLSLLPRRISVSLTDLGLSGKQDVRDLWRQKQMGSFDQEYAIEVPPHGVVLVKITPEAK